MHSDQTGHNLELKITGPNFPRAKALAKDNPGHLEY